MKIDLLIRRGGSPCLPAGRYVIRDFCTFPEISRFANGRSPLNDQGIFISIVVRNHTRNLKSYLGIKGLGSLIASSHLCPNPFKTGSLHRPLEEFPPDAFSSMVGVDGDRNNMAVLSKDDISPKLLFFLALVCIDPFDGAKALAFRRGRKVLLRVNPERTRSFRLRSRKVDIN